MKLLLCIFFCFPLFAFPQKVKIKASPGEYTSLIQRNDSAFDITAGKPVFITKNVSKIFGGSHHYFILFTNGTIGGAGDGSAGELGNGSTSGAATPTVVTVDNLGGTLPQMVDMCLSANLNSPFWQSAAIGVDGSLYVCGTTLGGALGDGTSGSATTTRFTKVPFPGGTVITKVQGGREMIALDNAGNVWTWAGNNDSYCLGQGSSPANYRVPTKVAFGGETAIDIAGGSNWNYILTSAGHIWSWCYQNLTDYNGTGTFGTGGSFTPGANPRTPENITTKLAFPATVAKIYVSNESSYAILIDSTLWAWGGNACGSIGNGQELNYAAYKCCPSPNSGSPSYYQWDQGFHELQVGQPVQIMKGIHNFTDIWVTNALCYTAMATDANGNFYEWGRNKQSLPYGVVPGNYINGIMQSDYPNSWDCPFPKLVDPFAATTIFQSPSPDCLRATGVQVHPDACASYSIPSHSAPTANLTATIIGNKIVLNNSASAPTDGRFIAYRIITQTGGTSLDMKAQDAIVDTIESANGSSIPNGTYSFRVKIINDNWDSSFATASATIGATPPTVNAGTNQTIQLPTNFTSLSGTATGNGGATIVSTTWSQISGPNSATITTPSSLTTTVTGLIAGIYVFQLSATDNNSNSNTSTINVTVNLNTCNCVPRLKYGKIKFSKT